MTLTIDDGTFLIGNTFLSLTDIDTYHEARLTPFWQTITDDDAKEAAIIRGFDYLKIQTWKSDVFLLGIPIRICDALCVAANKELETPGNLQADQQNNVKRKRIEGAIETEYFSKDRSSSVIFIEIGNLISSYLEIPAYRTQKFLVRM